MKITNDKKNELLRGEKIERIIAIVKAKGVKKGIKFDNKKHGKGKVNQEEEENNIEVGKCNNKAIYG